MEFARPSAREERALESAARRAAAGAAPERDAPGRSACSNGFAEHVSLSVQRGLLGTDVILRNEKDPSRRVQVFHSKAPNVLVGDVFFAADGHPLPRNANAVELEETLNPHDAGGDLPKMVHLSLWRATPEAFLGIGVEVAAAARSASSLGVRWKPLRLKRKDVDAYPQAALLDALYAAAECRDANGAVAVGDVLIGVNHAPLPEGLAPDAFRAWVDARRAAAGGGPPTLNLVRVTNPALRKIVLLRGGAVGGGACGGCGEDGGGLCLGGAPAAAGPEALYQVARAAPRARAPGR